MTTLQRPLRLIPRAARHEARPYAVGPLLDAVGADSIAAGASLLGLHPRQLLRLRKTGLTVDQADALACRAWLHPSSVWPEW